MINLLSKRRLLYFSVTLLIIILGLASRKSSIIPLFVGDMLWATMIFFILRFLMLNKDTLALGILSLAICFLVEISQLYQDDWINSIRNTLPGKLILGRGFLWIDLLAYTAGVFIGMMVDKLVTTLRITSS